MSSKQSKQRKWYDDKEGVALMTGFVSTFLTLLNIWIDLN